MSTNLELAEIARNFQLEGELNSAERLGSGHIHDTYRLTFDQAGSPKQYVLQRINHHVFKNPPQLMDNIVRVTTHIRAKLARNSESAEPDRRVLAVVPTTANASFYQDVSGSYWRVYSFVTATQALDILSNPAQATEIAQAFGGFLAQLSDLPGPSLHETIPKFLDGPARYQSLLAACLADDHNRKRTCLPELDFVKEQAWVFDVLPELSKQQLLPLRVTHNDTKANNVLLDDQSGRAVCVIDLDTVMPGYSLYDFGDMVRTCCSSNREDAREVDHADVVLPMYEALLRGYIAATGDLLTACEREHLAFSGMLMTLMVGTRFLTDYLEGDQYFPVTHQTHNLERCRNQFALVRSLERRQDQLNALLEDMRHRADRH